MSREASQDQWIQTAVVRFEEPLTLYAARILGDIDRARDVVQETFLRLCGQNPTDVGPHLLQWLFAVCRTRALDLRRRQRTRATSPIASTVACRIAAPSKQIEDRELAARIMNMLGTLPDNQRAVLTLKFQHSLTYKQISDQTGLTISNVGFLIHTGLKTLRRALEVHR